jgi:DNA-binding transcriptional ArsR family regulator
MTAVVVASALPAAGLLMSLPSVGYFDGSRRKERRHARVYFDGDRMTEHYLEMPAREELELPSVLQALADPVRLAIVGALAGGERPCTSFPLPVGDSTRSHHLRILRDAGVTATRVVGTQRLVALRREDLDDRFPGLLDLALAEVSPGTPG